ncbi:hypothetical protein ACHAPJ_008471 [Fusarium lateritium]
MGFFLWGTIDAFVDRRIGHACMSPEDRGTEDELGFGQIVAFVLLLAPAIGTADLWWNTIQDVFRRRQLDEPPAESVQLLELPLHSPAINVDSTSQDDPSRSERLRATT